MRFNNVEQEEISLDLAPLIDVVFLLLIFFMVTTSFTQDDAIELTLPEASSEQTQAREFTINITVSKLDEIYIQSDQTRFGKIASSEKRDTLSEKIRQTVDLLISNNPNRANSPPIVIIEADTKASHGRVIELMDVLSQLGISKIQFAVAPVTP